MPHDVRLGESTLRILALARHSPHRPLSTINTNTTSGFPARDPEATMDAFLPYEVNSEALNGKDW
jgi:hypothetical protein